MLLRPPSLSKPFDEFASCDPCFVQPPLKAEGQTDEDHTKAVEEYAAKIKAAWHTGDWTPMLVPGRALNEATKFTFNQIDRNVWREFLDRHTLPLDVPNRIGPGLIRALVFRLAIRSITGCPVEVRRTPDPQWNNHEMAGADLVNYLDGINPAIVGELGWRIMERLRGVDPLS